MIAVAFVLEVRSAPTVRHPFAAQAIAAGEPVEPRLEWRDVPAGLLPMPDVAAAVAGAPVAAGEPLLPSHLGPGFSVPAGWWSVPLALPESAGPGTGVRVIVDDPPFVTDGDVTGAAVADDFGFESAGLVAVPAEAAEAIARAAGRGGVTVLIAP